MSKKVSAAGIVLLFIFSVITPLVVGYDVEIDEGRFKENFLTDDFNEPGDLTHRICGEDYGKATSMKSLNEAHLFQQENDIDLSMGESLEFHEPSDFYSYLMKTGDGQDDEEYDSYKEVVNYPLDNSTICGYIIDNITEDPIEGARVIVFWSGNRGIDVNYTYSDSLGFYSINIEISVPIIVVRASGYFSEFISISNIEENETLWLNVSLDPGAPPENSVICGYITDNVTENPIDGADIIQVDYDALMYYDWNYTCTNSSGFYSVNIAAGDILILLYSDADDYYGNSVTKDDISENETVWINLSLVPLPPENSTVCGYITDNVTENPIENANVVLGWYGDQGHYYQNYTSTNSSGFYSMSVAAGTIYLYAYADGYYSEHVGYYDIIENETLWINISLYPRPPENSVVHGYVTDEETGDPIEDAYVTLDWRDEHGPPDWNYTYTNSSGFYSMNVAAGEIHLYVYADEYYSESTDGYQIDENETLWVNVSLYPRLPENSIVCGFINNLLTGDFIENAYVTLDWRDEHGHQHWNYTYTNSSGYYIMNVAAGEIDLYAGADGYFGEHTDDYDIGENETLWINISLYPRPPENSVVHGYVTDEETGDPIEDAYVDLDWQGDQGRSYGNYTYTNSSGYYSMNVAAGVIDLYAKADEYLNEYTDHYDIGEYEILRIDISMQFIINENSVVCGYVTDVETDHPIIDAYVSHHWYDNKGHSCWNYTFSDSSGYYSMNVVAGDLYIHVYAYGYLCEYTQDYEIGEYGTLWVNVSMTREVIEVDIIKPQKALYIANHRVLPLLFKPVIYGRIDIEVDASDGTTFVEFSIDGKIKATDDSEPYIWTWGAKTLLKHRHTIKVVAYGKFGGSASDEIAVWKFF